MSKVLFNIQKDEKNLQRKDFILKTLSKYLTPKESTILEIGIGNGRFGFLLAEDFKKYLGIDPDEEYINLAKKNIPLNTEVKYLVGKAEDVPFKEKVDVILYANVWHFVKDSGSAIKEIKRLLNNSGVVLIIEPSSRMNTWADERLNKKSEKFDSTMLAKKISKLKIGKEALLNQKDLEIIEQGELGESDFYVLKKK